MASTFQSFTALQAMVWGVLFFGGIYLLFGSITWLLTRRVLPALGIGRVLDPRLLQPGQVGREMRQSGVSVLVFGLGMVFPWGLLQLGWARLDASASGWQIVAEMAVLAVWNDVHFWLNHRLLHDFSFWSLASLPVFSLVFNNIGHANYDFFPRASYGHWFAASRRHHLHHACHAGNYGFQFTFMDRLFGTRLAADAAQGQLTAFQTRQGSRHGEPA